MKKDMGKLRNIKNLEKEDIDIATNTLSRAFQNDPLYLFYFPNLKKRSKKLRHIMKYSTQYCLEYGKAYSTSSKKEGIMLLLYSDEMKMPKINKLFKENLIYLLSMGINSSHKVFTALRYWVKNNKKVIPKEHWHLLIIGVDPEYHGKGYASTLLRPLTEWLDKNKLPCSLDTNNPKNVPIYKHFGFKVINEGKIPGTDVRNWLMLRE